MPHVDRAVVLAAGLGTRLKWLTAGQPKAMMDVAGEAAIVRVIRRLVSQGVADIAINVHHHSDKLMEYLGDGSKFGVRLYYSYEEKLLDSGGGVRRAMDLLPGDGLVAVHNADVIADIDVQRLAGEVLPRGGALAMVTNPSHHPEGDFGIEGDKIIDRKAHSLTYSGVSVWDDQALDSYENGDTFSLTSPMRQLMGKSKLRGVKHQGFWFDIGRPRELMLARMTTSRL